MKILFGDRFQKKFKILPVKIQKQFEKRISLFMENHSHPLLKAHALKGYLTGYRAFSVTGDYRVIYRLIDRETVKLVDMGTHSQIY